MNKKNNIEYQKKKKIKRLIIISPITILFILVISFLFRVWVFPDTHNNWYLEFVYYSDSTINDLSHVKYNQLSSDYKNVISRKEFNSATGDDLYALFSKINSVDYNPNPIFEPFIRDAMTFKTPAIWYYEYNGDTYIIEYEMYIRPPLVGFGVVIEKWNISIIKYNKETGEYIGERFYP